MQVTIDDGRLNLSVKHESVSEEEGSKYIHRERRMSQMSRSILLKDVSEEGAQAKLEDGVLTLILPKKENLDTSKRIMIE
ncbi:Hsp20 family protein [Exiguobacterium aurantiacum]|uniref:Hsp20 family protein n=1 Tax=Exiguobacterium aurantiacum TaxID=33987 RepID=UPI001C3FDEC5